MKWRDINLEMSPSIKVAQSSPMLRRETYMTSRKKRNVHDVKEGEKHGQET